MTRFMLANGTAEEPTDLVVLGEWEYTFERAGKGEYDGCQTLNAWMPVASPAVEGARNVEWKLVAYQRDGWWRIPDDPKGISRRRLLTQSLCSGKCR